MSDASISVNADAIRAKLVSLYARLVRDGTITEAEAADRLRAYDAETLRVTHDDLPLEPGEITAPSIADLYRQMEDR